MSASEPSTPAPFVPPTSMFATVAATLYARTGAWPSWFLDVVSEPVPQTYVDLALHIRTDLESELGVALPVCIAQERPRAKGSSRSEGMRS